MRWIVLLLLIANLVVGGFFFWGKSQSDALAGVNAPLNSSKIVLRSARILDDTTPSDTSASPALNEHICVEWRGMTESNLERSREAVKKLAVRRVLSVKELPVDRMYWVIFPPLPSEAAAKVKMDEFAALKVKDALIIKEDHWKNGISLGLFSADEAARSHIRVLESKGVSGLRIETRPKQGTGYYYVVKSEDATTLRELDEIRSGFPATTLMRVDCKK